MRALLVQRSKDRKGGGGGGSLLEIRMKDLWEGVEEGREEKKENKEGTL